MVAPQPSLLRSNNNAFQVTLFTLLDIVMMEDLRDEQNLIVQWAY